MWSPASTRIAFAENAFVYFRDGDIWVMDAESGDLIDLTDEGICGTLPILGASDSDITEFLLDSSPAWSADSQTIVFSRTTWRDGEWRGNSIETIPPTDGEPELLTVTRLSEPDNQVFVQDAPDGEPVKLGDGLTAGAAIIAFGVIPNWATDGSVYINAHIGIGTLLTLNDGESQSTTATPSVIETRVASEIAPGAAVTVA